ncbi:MAG TPA: thioredoxin-like domain-containing protein [Chthoniobacteraceae bacterium]|jgi:peroxiredoxin
MTRSVFLIAVLLVLLSSGPARAQTAETAWQAIVALDAGPKAKTRTPEEARAAALDHLNQQEKALRDFIRAFPHNEHAFEAQLRLARLLQIRGDVQGSAKAIAESRAMLDALEKTAAAEQRAELDFARLTLVMRSMKAPGAADRQHLLASARRFQTAHPTDRRLGALLAEVASLFTLQPKTMEGLLRDAQSHAKDPELSQRISDDLKRLELLGQRPPLSFTTVQGTTFDVEQVRGSVAVVVFFAVWSKPSLEVVENVRQALGSLSNGQVKLVGVSLDTKREPLTAFLTAKKITWPVSYDGAGWESSLVRSLGVNGMPTVWLLDRQGRLRSLNGAESTESQVRQLLNER